MRRHPGIARRPDADPTTTARAVPIYATTSYVFHDIIHIRTHWLRDTGADAESVRLFLTLLGLETLHVRLSVGIEDVRDIIADLDQALKVSLA